MPGTRTLLLAAAAAVLARRALRRRVRQAPLWPLPALEEPVSGRGRRSSTTPRRVLVTERTEPAAGVVRLRLEGVGLPPWSPGAHLDLVLPSGLVRQYSLCGDPADTDTYTVAARVLADGRGGSLEVRDQLHEGTEVEIRGPRNRFPLVDAETYVFVAGGIGITPVLPMVRAVHAAGADWRLLYCGRDRASMPFADELEELGAGGPHGSRTAVVAEDTDGRPDLSFLAELPDTAEVYCCGPDGLMEAVTRALGRAPAWSGSRRPRRRAVRSGWSCAAPAPPWTWRPGSRCWRRCAPRCPMCRTRANRASAARASSGCWRARSTTKTSCSPTTSGTTRC